MKNLNFFLTCLIAMLSFSLFLFSCKEDDEEIVPSESETYTLNAVAGSGVSGTATFEKINTVTTRITVELAGTSEGDSHPMHIHNNSVAEGGGIAISLTSVNGANGMSVTDVTQMDNGTPIAYEQLIDFDGYINVHLSTANMAIIIAQGDIGQNAP